jgi:hypothetical protein
MLYNLLSAISILVSILANARLLQPGVFLEARCRSALKVPHAIAHYRQQRLTPEQEDFLVKWILEEDTRSQPPSHAHVGEMAI